MLAGSGTAQLNTIIQIGERCKRESFLDGEYYHCVSDACLRMLQTASLLLRQKTVTQQNWSLQLLCFDVLSWLSWCLWLQYFSHHVLQGSWNSSNMGVPQAPELRAHMPAAARAFLSLPLLPCSFALTTTTIRLPGKFLLLIQEIQRSRPLLSTCDISLCDLLRTFSRSISKGAHLPWTSHQLRSEFLSSQWFDQACHHKQQPSLICGHLWRHFFPFHDSIIPNDAHSIA